MLQLGTNWPLADNHLTGRILTCVNYIHTGRGALVLWKLLVFRLGL
jgi:hypothetical protein